MEEPVCETPPSVSCSILISPATDFDSVALNLFIRDVLPSPRLENLPPDLTAIDTAFSPLYGVVVPLYTSSTSSGPLVTTLLAMAWATSAYFASAEYGIGKARKKYVEAISRLQAALQDSEIVSRDDTLLTVLFLGWIEVGRLKIQSRDLGIRFI